MATDNHLVRKLINLASLRNDLLMGWKLIWQASQGWSIVWLLIHVVLGCVPLAQIALVKLLVDSVTRGFREGMSSPAMKQALLYGVLMAGVALLNEVLQSLLDWVKALQAEKIRDYISALVHRKSVEVDLAFYESPEYFDSLYRARDDAQNRPLNLLDHLGNVIQTGITLALFAAIMATYGPWMLAAILLSMAPAVFIVLRHNKLIHEWWAETTVQRRWADYYDQRFTSPAAAPEMRLFNLGDYFHHEYQAIRDQLRADRLGMIRNQTFARLGSTIATLAIVGASIGWVGWRVVHGTASLGDLALCYQAFLGGQGLMRMCTASMGHVYNDALFLGTFFQFLATKPRICSPEHPVPAPKRLRNGVRFRNVTFHYPGSDALALRNLNLTIPAGRVVAIVGKNGAGKSTLVKLLSRFYDPEEGSIELDGVDLRAMDLQDLRNSVSILFQTPPSYDASVEDNIRYGDLVGDAEESRVIEAARNAGADEFIERLPNGYQSLLGKSFENGNELSAGQWQRIAMARAFLRRSPLVLLDEPTSFMDPWAEHDWFERLRGLCAGRTAVIITHRFSIAMRADLIHLMNAGEVLESGTHQDLVVRNGLYAESWKLQMQAHADCAGVEERDATASFAD
jgi:ATP-binding cassette subfamily B protein